MSEKFEIEITDYGFIGGLHFYGRVNIPKSRQVGEYSPSYYHELQRPNLEESPSWWDKKVDGPWMTIKFWTIRDIIKAAKEWFLSDPRVKPGDKLTIHKESWERRNEKL
jgi:uncharacterized protein Usg